MQAWELRYTALSRRGSMVQLPVIFVVSHYVSPLS